jgi:hypothetical protein
LLIIVIILFSCSKGAKLTGQDIQIAESEQNEIINLKETTRQTNVNITIDQVAINRRQIGIWPINNTEYIVINNNVNIRNSPSIDSKVIGELSFPEIIYVNEIIGSNEIKNGVLDRWARIHVPSIIDDHADYSIWINCYYIASLPLIVSSRAKYDIMGVSEDDTISITGYYWNDGKMYFKIATMLDSFDHDDVTYNIVARPEIQGISIINNSWTRLYNFCDNFLNRMYELSNTWSNSTENPDYIFDYGIRCGINSRLLEETLGVLYGIENITWNGLDARKYIHSALYIGYGHKVEFIIVDNNVVKINYELIK